MTCQCRKGATCAEHLAEADLTLPRGPEIEIRVPDEYVPQGQLVGVVDEYGTIWAAEPGASERIGDLVARSDEETAYVYIDLGKVA